MSTPEEQARQRDRENRDGFAIRRIERDLDREERRLEDEMAEFDDETNSTERRIEGELRQEHLGHEPERPPAWTHREPGAL